MLRKLTSLFFLLFLMITLVGCDKNKPNDKTTQPGEEQDVTYDMGGAEFVIMADSPTTGDPRSEDYGGIYQRERIALIEKAEAKYNVKVVYKPYPAEANWGAPRESWIINSVLSGTPGAHAFEMSTVSIPTLASAGALMPLKSFIEKYDNNEMDRNTAEFGYHKGEFYGYYSRPPQNSSGILYNQDLFEDYGYEPDHPTQLYIDGEWTWEKFEELVRDLNDKLNEQEGFYPIGGLTYEWATQFIAANGGYMVNKDHEIGLENPETMEALDYMAKLYDIEGMWTDKAVYWYGTEPLFQEGKVAFQIGEAWWLTYDTRLGARSFERVGYVPLPTGPSTNEDLSNYHSVNLFGPGTFVLSAGYEKENIPTGYEDIMLYDELIFQIWRDLQHKGDQAEYNEDFAIDLMRLYADRLSVDAHLEVMDTLYNEQLYAINEPNHVIRNDYILDIERAIKENNIRAQIQAIIPSIEADLKNRFE